jgi:hypothetical protein
LAEDQALGYLAPASLGVADEKAGGAMGQDAVRDAGLVADLLEEDKSVLQQTLGGNRVGSTPP